MKVTGGKKSKLTHMAGSSSQSSVPPEVLALQNPLSPEGVTCHRNPSGVIVPKIMKRGDHCYAEHVPQVQVATCATVVEAAEEDLKPLPWKQYHPDTLKRYVCAVACCDAPFPPDVSFHAIPKNPAVRKAWVAACRRKDLFNPNKSYVCSQHFKEEDIERDLKSELMNKEKKRKIRAGAVPSLHLLPSTQNQSSVPLVIPKTDRTLRAEKKEQQNVVESMLTEDIDDVCPEIQGDNEQDKGCQTEDPLLEENNALRNRIKCLEEELKNAKEHPVLSEKEKVKVAKEVLSKSAWSKQQINHLLDDKQRSRWSSEDIVLGLTIRGLSKKVYQFLRAKKLLPLPGLSTLKQHIRSFTCSPGIQSNILDGESRFDPFKLLLSLLLEFIFYFDSSISVSSAP